jgi:hypothetical protein
MMRVAIQRQSDVLQISHPKLNLGSSQNELSQGDRQNILGPSFRWDDLKKSWDDFSVEARE